MRRRQCASSSGGSTVASLGGNLEFPADASCPFEARADPRLGPLADNGGPTETRALLTGSPARDRGSDAGCPATDQRGVARPQGSRCDIGAYERRNGPPVARNDSYSGTEDRTLRVPARGVLRNDTDADRDPLRATLVTRPGNGKLSLKPSGAFTFKPRRNSNGTVRFLYGASDGHGGGDRAVVTLRLKARPR